MRSIFFLCCALGLFVIAGCGQPTTSGSCLVADQSRCTDYSERASDLASNQSECTGSGNAWGTGACVTTGTVGGCTRVEGIATETDWYFGTARPTVQVQSACAASGGSFRAQ